MLSPPFKFRMRNVCTCITRSFKLVLRPLTLVSETDWNLAIWAVRFSNSEKFSSHLIQDSGIENSNPWATFVCSIEDYWQEDKFSFCILILFISILRSIAYVFPVRVLWSLVYITAYSIRLLLFCFLLIKLSIKSVIVLEGFS